MSSLDDVVTQFLAGRSLWAELHSSVPLTTVKDPHVTLYHYGKYQGNQPDLLDRRFADEIVQTLDGNLLKAAQRVSTLQLRTSGVALFHGREENHAVVLVKHPVLVDLAELVGRDLPKRRFDGPWIPHVTIDKLALDVSYTLHGAPTLPQFDYLAMTCGDARVIYQLRAVDS